MSESLSEQTALTELEEMDRLVLLRNSCKVAVQMSQDALGWQFTLSLDC